MQLAFILYKYFPFGGLQRDFMRIALECQRRGHSIRVYAMIWEGEVPDGFEVLIAPVKALFNHTRNERFTAWVEADLAKRPVDRVIGFNTYGEQISGMHVNQTFVGLALMEPEAGAPDAA